MLVSQLLQLFIPLAELVPPGHSHSTQCEPLATAIMVFNSGELSKEKCSFLYPHANRAGHTAGRDSWIQSGPAGQEYGMVWQPTIPLPFTSLPCLVDGPTSDILGGREGFWGKCWSSLGFGSWELRMNPHLGLCRVFASWPGAGAQEQLLSEEWELKLCEHLPQIWLSETKVGQRTPEAIILLLSSFLGHGKGSSKNCQGHFSLCIFIHSLFHSRNTSWHTTLYIREVEMNKARSLPWRG